MPEIRRRPAFLRSVANAAGADIARALTNEFGGRRIYIPKRPQPGQMLVESLGLEAVKRIAELFGGEVVEVPKAADSRSTRKPRKRSKP